MGSLPEQIKSLLQIVGAVGVALAVEYDRNGAFTFIVPALMGILILIGSWVSSTALTHRMSYLYLGSLQRSIGNSE